MYDCIIIGSGPSGLTASIYTRRAGLNSAVFEKLFAGGQLANTYEIENYTGFTSISGPELSSKMAEHAKVIGGNFINEEITEIIVSDKTKIVKTASNQYECVALIISTGAKPRLLGIPGEKEFTGRGVSYCATCDGAFYRGKEVAVIGGGNTAVEDAIFLARFCTKVYLIHRRDKFRADKTLWEKVLSLPNVEPIYDTVGEEIVGDNFVTSLKLKNVVTNENRQLNLQGVFIAVGVSPNSNLAEGKLATDSHGYIITNEKMETNIAGVFAAGDARNTPLRQVITSAADGAIAAYFASIYIAGL